MSDSNLTYDLLAIGAHPDDVEVGTGGVLIGLAERGYRCGVVVLTEGEMGTGGTATIRAEELKSAAQVLGADIVETFDWGDARLEETYERRFAMAAIIRRTQPRVVLAPWPHIAHGRRQSHPDHVAAGIIAVNACSLATLTKADLPGEPHLVTRIFHYFLPPGIAPDFVVDITPHYDCWIKALSAHKSQFLNPDKSRNYLESLSSMARSFGNLARCKYAQGFRSAEPVAVRDIMTLAEKWD